MAELQEVKVCLGRFQPFTLGHLKMATYKDLKGPDKEQQDKLREQPDLKEIAKQKTIILVVSTPEDKVDTRHPFNDEVMKREFDIIKKNYKDDIEDVLYVKSADICAWGALLKEHGYKASVWLTGSDEFSFYKGMAIKVPEYEEKNIKDCAGAYTPSFYVEEIERTENKDFVSSISGTKVRQSLLDGDKELFTKMMPKGVNKYFDEFKEKAENAPEPKKKKKRAHTPDSGHHSCNQLHPVLCYGPASRSLPLGDRYQGLAPLERLFPGDRPELHHHLYAPEDPGPQKSKPLLLRRPRRPLPRPLGTTGAGNRLPARRLRHPPLPLLQKNLP